MPSLLAVDLGLKTGLALFGDSGKLVWYRSHNFGTTERLKRAVHGILNGIPGLTALVIEGGGNLAVVWEKAAMQSGIAVCRVDAATWRQVFLFPREQRTGVDAKRHAIDMARRIIGWSGAVRPTSLRHDAAEAILIGLWGVVHFGWLPEFPVEVRH
jgi:hypothetical protein